MERVEEALMSMDHQTSKVVEMYNHYPFPSKGNHNNYFETFVLPTIIEIKKSCRISRLLDAGCGTGNISIDMARHLPDIEITAIDFTDESLRMAQSKAMSLQLKNIKFQKSNLLEYDPKLGVFDFIYCQGVIHHLSSPFEGMRNLNRYLKHNGHAFVWLYGLLGRRNISDTREALKILGVESLPWEKKLGIAAKTRPLFLDKRRTLLRKIINVLERLDQYGLDGFGRYLKGHLPIFVEGTPENIWLADTILHPQDKYYRFSEALNLFSETGFSFVRVLEGMSNTLAESFGSKELADAGKKLSFIEAYQLVELHEKPGGIGFLIKKESSRM